MNFREEIQDMLRSNGISSGTDVNKTIFAIATLGLLIEQEELLQIAIHCGRADRMEFEHRILSVISLEHEKEIANTVLRYIPTGIDNRVLLNIIEIVTKFDLKHIVLDSAIYDNTLGSSEYNKATYPITSVQCLDFLFTECKITKKQEKQCMFYWENYNTRCYSRNQIWSMTILSCFMCLLVIPGKRKGN